MNTFKKLIGVATGALFAVSVSTVHAVSIGQSMGTIENGNPPSEANETHWVNDLINYHNGAGGANPFPSTTNPVNQGPESITAVNFSLVDGVLPAAVFAQKLESNLDGLLGAGHLYLLAKYGGGQGDGISVVYYLGGAALDVPDSSPTTQLGLSHVTLFNPSTTRVPDGGATAILLGLGLAGLAAVRRKH